MGLNERFDKRSVPLSWMIAPRVTRHGWARAIQKGKRPPHQGQGWACLGNHAGIGETARRTHAELAPEPEPTGTPSAPALAPAQQCAVSPRARHGL